MGLTCVIIEDQTMFLQMLHNMLRVVPDLRVVATAQTEEQGIVAVETHRPDVLVLDLHLPDGNGVKVARRLAAVRPDARVVILSGEASTFVCPAGLKEQVHAVIDKTQAFDELDAVIKTLLPKARGGSSSARSREVRDLLSEREYEVFVLVGRGFMSKEIAETLRISPQTVQAHRRKIADKLGTAGSEFVQLAIKHYHTTFGAQA